MDSIANVVTNDCRPAGGDISREVPPGIGKCVRAMLSLSGGDNDFPSPDFHRDKLRHRSRGISMDSIANIVTNDSRPTPIDVSREVPPLRFAAVGKWSLR